MPRFLQLMHKEQRFSLKMNSLRQLTKVFV